MSDSVLDEVLACAEAGDLEPLAYKLEWLQAPMTDAERLFLARYLRGEVKLDANRPKQSPRIKWEALAILDVILWEEQQGGKRKHAIEHAAKVCGLSEATIKTRLKLLSDEEQQSRRESLNAFLKMCDELNKRRPGRGDWQREAKRKSVMSGELFRAARVGKKSR
ncbi:hypothetical protein SOQ14_12060 [Erythrobacter sp. T5W1-R]|uniref:hypothetical protein n=1 Tax=Erythrobacter sp. T5W1-R TaxID=3101752 RepID=UPI002AFFA310|nr:hypothetical protein [Erythrobacter sp. T5W1-R]MEA1619652.1 hypothetical protein [Erythrobacter sp. T5W1-R]